jgi:hypothetical protein
MVGTRTYWVAPEFRQFCETEGLPFKSASDLRHEPGLTAAQAEYIRAFIERWDDSIDRWDATP